MIPPLQTTTLNSTPHGSIFRGILSFPPKCGISKNDTPDTTLHKFIACVIIFSFACLLALCIFAANYLLKNAFPQLQSRPAHRNITQRGPGRSIRLPILDSL